MDTQIQLQLAKEAGKVDQKGFENSTWLDEYKYHLGMVRNPLPFGLFRLKFRRFNGMLEKDPDGKNRAFDKPLQDLGNELGY